MISYWYWMIHHKLSTGDGIIVIYTLYDYMYNDIYIYMKWFNLIYFYKLRLANPFEEQQISI